jgi:hypothetical protein
MDVTGDKEVFCDDTCAGVCGFLSGNDSTSGMVSGYAWGSRLERTDCECIEYDLEPDEEETVPAGESG